MIRYSRGIFCVLLCYALSLSAQQSTPAPNNDESRQVPHVAPPSANLSPEELENEGDSLRAQKDYLDAIDYYKAGMRKSDSAPLHNKSGVALLQLARYSEAKKEFARAIKMSNTYAEAHNNLGVVEYVKKNYGGAVKEYKRAIKINPELSTAYIRRAGVFERKGDQERARADRDHATLLDHGSPQLR